jgi:3-hydroxybutyryl-CoA dehydrogenase
MGGGIAIGCIAAGLETRVIDSQVASLQRLQARAQKFFDRLVVKEQLMPEGRNSALSALSVSTDLTDVCGADLIIEAVFEDLDVKRKLLGDIAMHVEKDTLVATNTSALRVSDMANALPYPQNFLGLHYFSPAEHNPVVELVAGTQTSENALNLAKDFLNSTGKTVISCNDSSGFAVNRFFCPYTNEAVRIVDEGLATTGQIDEIAHQVFDLAIGPFTVMNIVKPRINLSAVSNLSGLGAFYEPATGLQKIGVADGIWDIEENPEALLNEQKEIVTDRLLASVFFPVLEAISEGVASPEAIDLGATKALRFGHPPVALMKSLGKDKVETILAPLLVKFDHAMPEAGLRKVFS